jgi:hypothetical protein
MARGVSSNFLALARREHRLGQRVALAALALALPAAFLAELADQPGYGPIWLLFLAALALGLLGGWAWGKRRREQVEGDLKLRWNHWMWAAMDAGTLADVERRVHDRDPLPPWLGSVAAVLLVGLNVALFALLWVEHAAAQPLAWVLLAVDGLVLGALATSSLLMARWADDFAGAAEDMVKRGELPIWGER